MSASSAGSYDAIVIGAGVNGLAAAALLAGAGAAVLLLERELAPPEPSGVLYALDPMLVAQLRLTRLGLRFQARDLPLVGLADDLPPLVLGRNLPAAARALASLSQADAKAWPPFRRHLWAMARRLRRWWWHGHQAGQPADILESRAARAAFERLAYLGADALLAAHFQSEPLKALLLFDALAGGFAPSQPGSALALAWRASQEMAGLQDAAALPARGTLIAALTRAGRGVEMRMAAPVARIRSHDRHAAGVTLEDGSEIQSRIVLSAIGEPATRRLMDECECATARTGDAQLVFATAGMPAFPMPFNTGRMIIADAAGLYADAYETARAGLLPRELPLECVAEGDRLFVTARPVPLAPRQGWPALKPVLAAQVAKTVNCRAPGFARAIRGIEIHLPAPRPRAGLAQLLAPPAARLGTGLPNVFLCGRDAEPVPAVSGRAGRMAAALAVRALAALP